MPTCSQNRKCPENKKSHRALSPRPCIVSHRIPTCQHPFIRQTHCMAPINNCNESEDDETKENVQVVDCPYTPSTNDLSKEEKVTKTCCVRNVDSKGQEQNFPPGFKAHISVDIATDPQPNLAPGCCNIREPDSIPKEPPTPKLSQDKGPCCARPKTSQTVQKTLSSQGLIKRSTTSTPKIKDIDEALSQESIESEISDKPCCANAYPRARQEPLLPPKGISGTARPGYVVNKESAELIADEISSECMKDGTCVHGITSIMPKKQKRDSTCFCGAKKRESHVCDTGKSVVGQKQCPCRYPPGYGQYSCSGNITGVCKCSGEFK